MITFLEQVGASASLVKTPSDASLPRVYRVLMGAAALLLGAGFGVAFLGAIIGTFASQSPILLAGVWLSGAGGLILVVASGWRITVAFRAAARAARARRTQ